MYTSQMGCIIYYGYINIRYIYFISLGFRVL